MIRFIGDLHLRKEEPFLSCAKKTLKHLLTISKAGDTLFFLGDFFHTARPYPEELEVARDFFEKANSQETKVIILAGNHEYLHTRDTFVEDIFKNVDVTFIDNPNEYPAKKLCPTETELDDYGIMCLPWLPNYRLKKMGWDSLKDFYHDYFTNVYDDTIAKCQHWIVVYHFEDETTFTGLDDVGVDISAIQSEFPDTDFIRIGGHIHIATENYLGVPYPTRKDEVAKTYYMATLDKSGVKYEPLPSDLLTFQTMEYEDLLKFEPDQFYFYMLDVLGVPTTEALFDWQKKHTNVFFNNYEFKFNEDRVILEDNAQADSTHELLELFIKQNKTDPETANYLLSIM